MEKNEFDVVIVGAGISGATIAERYSRLKNMKVLVIDQRDHVGGNCYDYYQEDGILVAKYGPHYFHTNDIGVWNYVNQFSEWKNYEHKVLAIVGDKKVPVPVNIKTVNLLFDENIKDEKEMSEWLDKNTEKIESPKNSEEVALTRVGKKLYELIFKNYTIKQWAREPKELGVEVLSRIPVRTNFDDRYFTDIYQALPKDGYTKIFENIFDHPNIKVMLSTSWDDIKENVKWKKLFFTGKIDSFFKDSLGSLEYRSLRFEHEVLDQEYFQDVSQENYPDLDYKYTRIVEHKRSTGQKHPKTVITKEYPMDVGEPYYPVPNKENQEKFNLYQKEAKKEESNNVYFVGRLANYKYFNMDQAFRNSLDLFYSLEKDLPKEF